MGKLVSGEDTGEAAPRPYGKRIDDKVMMAHDGAPLHKAGRGGGILRAVDFLISLAILALWEKWARVGTLFVTMMDKITLP
jgi:hypothetical protein